MGEGEEGGEEKEREMEKVVMLVAVDESEHSTYALNWTIDHFFSPFDSNNRPFRLILLHAKPTPSGAVALAGPVIANTLPSLDIDLRNIASRVISTAKEACLAKSVNDVEAHVYEGDARNVICEAVEKYHASMLVVGSHSYGAIKRAVLGSVSDYCAHHAHCSVMIVKKPKNKH